MKTLPLLFCGVSLFALDQSLFAQTKSQPPAGDPFLKNPSEASVPGKGGNAAVQSYQLLLEVYSLDKNDAYILLESERGSAARYRAMTDLAKSGKARLDTLTSLTTVSENESEVAGVDELRYATEFAPPAKTNGLAIPSEFDKRDTGELMKFTIEAGAEGRICKLDIRPERTTLLGFVEISGVPGELCLTQPRFSVQRRGIYASFPFNEPHFLGSLNASTIRGVANGKEPSEVSLAFARVQQISASEDDLKKPEKPLDWSTINLEYRIFSLERAAARELLVSSMASQSLWKNLQPMVSQKKARFEHLVAIQAGSEEEAQSDEVQEFRYASKYVPRSPKEVENMKHTPPAKNTASVTDKEDQTASTDASAKVTSSNTNTEQPTVCEMDRRDCGVKLKVTPALVLDGSFIHLDHRLESTAYIGDLKAKGLPGHYPRQPVFETRRLQSSLVVTSEKQTFVGTLNPPAASGIDSNTDQDRIWLVFVKATSNER